MHRRGWIQPRVAVRRRSGAGVGDEFRPFVAPVARLLNQVSAHLGPAFVVRRAPLQIDLRRSIRHRLEPGRRIGHGCVGRGAGDIRARPLANLVDRRDAVVHRRGRIQPRVAVRRRSGAGVGDELLPNVASVARLLDPVAAHRGPAVVVRRAPLQIDLRRSIFHRLEPGRRIGHRCVGRGAGDIRRSARTGRIERRHPIVSGRRRRQSGVGVRGHIRSDVCLHRPRYSSVGGDVHPVSADVVASVVGGGRPREVDPRRIGRHRLEPGRRIGHGCVGRGAVRVRYRTGARLVDRRDAVVPRLARIQPAVRVARQGGAEVPPHRHDPRRRPGLGHLELVPGNVRTAVVIRLRPREVDPRRIRRLSR